MELTKKIKTLAVLGCFLALFLTSCNQVKTQPCEEAGLGKFYTVYEGSNHIGLIEFSRLEQRYKSSFWEDGALGLECEFNRMILTSDTGVSRDFQISSKTSITGTDGYPLITEFYGNLLVKGVLKTYRFVLV